MTGTYILSIVVAALLGGAIGLEREYRSKEAGFRTHFLVGLGSGLLIVLSMHGFDDFLGIQGIQRDPSRIAAQVVSGMGFIGAGCIIFQKNAVKGLTTAAGLWVTSAIGMTAGAGMFLLATVATALVLLCLEGSNFIHHKIFHEQEEPEDSYEPNTKRSDS
ncbi:MAG: MgtC/SapB family protein [Prevotella sp.]|nr:MgtC/SapB family protein [Prevotella sp.]